MYLPECALCYANSPRQANLGLGPTPSFVIPLLVCLSILFVAGFLTVVTASFTHFAIGGTVRDAFREFFVQTGLFIASAYFWAVTVWLGLTWLADGVTLRLLVEILGAAHFPLLAYPLTIVPTLGFRLEQILRMAVYAVFVSALVLVVDTSPVVAALICLPGWLFHFLTQEARLLRKARS